MRESIRSAMEIAIGDYGDRERAEWVLAHPAMIVLNASQVAWTREAEEAFQGESVPQFAENQAAQLQELVKIIANPKLPKTQRTSIGALIVLDVHAKDVVQGFVDRKVHSASSFDWISQL